MDLLIKNALLVDGEGARAADLAVSDGRIAGIGADISPAPETRVIDAAGKYVFPGIIDAHTHYLLRSRGHVTADDFESGSVSAACGGVTTFIDYADQAPGKTLVQSARERLNEARGRACVDHTVHVVVTRITPNLQDELFDLAGFGVSSLKAFTTYRRAGYKLEKPDLRALLEMAARAGLLVTVHAEDDDLVEDLEARFKAEGKTAPSFHGRARPAAAEAQAVREVVALAAECGTPVYIVHVSSAAGLEAATAGREAATAGREAATAGREAATAGREAATAGSGGETVGLEPATSDRARVYLETCPHYLILTDDAYAGPDPELFLMTPPLRPAGNGEALWGGIRDGYIEVVATDHCAFTPEQKALGNTFFDVLPGIPGSETLLPLMFSEGTARGRITLPQMVRALSENPARIFGIYPRKGALQVGSDADLVIFDPRTTEALQGARLHSGAGYTPYEGLRVTGRVDLTILGGRVIVERGEFIGPRGVGRYIPAVRGPVGQQ